MILLPESTRSVGSSRHDIAGRLRQLFAHSATEPSELARRLGVDEVSLRMSIDELAPYPTLDVLSATVVLYGVDPTFLVTGEYDQDTHWIALDGGLPAAQHVLSRIGASGMRPTPSAGLSEIPERPHLRLA